MQTAIAFLSVVQRVEIECRVISKNVKKNVLSQKNISDNTVLAMLTPKRLSVYPYLHYLISIRRCSYDSISLRYGVRLMYNLLLKYEN